MSIVTKNLEVGLDLTNPLGQCNNENILHILRNKYQNRCYRHCLILTVDDIIRKGECIINPIVNLGTVAIIIRVTAIEYSAGDVITGCLIEDINDKFGIITCTNKYASVLFVRSEAFTSLRKGQYVNVKVGTAKYSIGAYKIAVNGTAYLPSKHNTIYAIDNYEFDNDILADVKERISDEEKFAIKMKGEKSWKVFKQLTSAYLAPPKITNGEVVSIDIATTRKPKYISRDARLDLTTPSVLIMDAIEDTDAAVVKVSFGEALIAMYEDYCSQLRIIREMLEVYSSEDSIVQHANLWNIYKKNMDNK
jgi:hypothetical protein